MKVSKCCGVKRIKCSDSGSVKLCASCWENFVTGAKVNNKWYCEECIDIGNYTEKE